MDADNSGQHRPAGDWPQAAGAVPARARPALTATFGQLAAAAGHPAAAQGPGSLTFRTVDI